MTTGSLCPAKPPGPRILSGPSGTSGPSSHASGRRDRLLASPRIRNGIPRGILPWASRLRHALPPCVRLFPLLSVLVLFGAAFPVKAVMGDPLPAPLRDSSSSPFPVVSPGDLPGRRAIRVLARHSALWETPRLGLGLSSGQRRRIRRIIRSTRAAMIASATEDLRLRELFESSLLSRQVSLGTLRRLRGRIDAVEAREIARFASSFRALQGILTATQRLILRQNAALPLPVARIALFSGFSGSLSLLALREREFPAGPESAGTLRRLTVLAAERTIAERALEDLLNRPLVERTDFDRLEQEVSLRSRRFWNGYFDLLLLTDHRSERGTP